jgi:putative ABC transport system permease protein
MLRDLRLALRAFRTWRWGALLAVLTLALGIGTTTALYALLRVALADSAVEIDEVDRVVRIAAVNPTLGERRSPVTLDDFDLLQSSARSFEAVAAYHDVAMTAGAEDDVVTVMLVSPRFFDVLRGRAMEGRLLTPGDRADDAPTAVVSQLTWRRRFAGRRIAEAPSIRLNGREHAVIGVLPASFSYSMIGIAADVYIPLSRRGADGARVRVISRLAPGVSAAAAAGELSTLVAPNQPEPGWRWGGIPVQQDVRARRGGATAWIFLPAAVVLIIGCVNVACLLLARGLRRDTELSVRMALGASRGAIFRQLLIENSVLGVAAGLVGTALAFAGLDLIVRTLIEMKPELAPQLSGDLGLLPIAVTSSVAACLLFGLVPALRLSRRDVAASLKGSAPAARVRVAGYGARDLVVFVELTLASVLVVMTAMSFAIFSVLENTQVGYAVNELLDVQIPARDAAAAVERVRAIGGVARVAIASGGLGGGTRAMASAPGGATTAVSIVEAGDGFFETAGLPIVQGRPFLPDETAGAAVAVVSETAASAVWPGEDAVGKQFTVTVRGRSTRLVVIGVTRDAIRMALPREQPGDVYRPLDLAAQAQVTLLARSPRPSEIARHVATAVRPRDTLAPVHVRVVADRVREFTSGAKLLRLFGGFALIALLLAGSGIFAVVSQSVAQRTAEFGVRLALGATPWRVLRTVLARELQLIGAALATGTVGTIAMTRSSGFDDAAFIIAVNRGRPEWGIAMIALCGAVAAGACLLATYRIVKLDPAVVLRRT